jgi:type IV pilus assembly protein PilM
LENDMISWNFKIRNYTPIGLDIGHHSIKMIQLAVNKDASSVIATGEVCINPDVNSDEQKRNEFIIAAIKQMLDSGNFHGRDVVSALPNDYLKVTNLRITKGNTDDIAEVMKREAAHRFGFNSEGDVVNYMLAGDVQSSGNVKSEWVLFAAPDEALRNHIEMIQKASLHPVSIDAVPCALFRSFKRFKRRQEDQDHSELFVDVGSKFTTVVLARGEVISFIKQIPVGGENFNREIAARLGIDIKKTETLRETLRMEKIATFKEKELAVSSSDLSVQSSIDASTRQVVVDSINTVAEELAREISLCVKYYVVTFRGKLIEQVVLCGGEAYETILVNVLKRQLATEICIAQPLKGFDMVNVDFSHDKREWLCEWTVALGLALKR